MTKRKSILAKGIILAMVLSLVIPTPVLAAGKGGGKLIKNVTTYDWNQTKNRWEKAEKVGFTYDKKAYPKEKTTTMYSDYRFGIPFSASLTKEKAKYKYKGKTPKSMKLKNTAGKVTETRKYKKGRVTSISSNDTFSSTEYDDNGNYIGEVARTVKSSSSIKYNKKGLAVSGTSSYNENKGGRYPYTEISSSNATYSVTHKKGVPSQIITSSMGSYYKNVNGHISQNTDTEPSYYYSKFNKKGLVTETGYISVDSVTKAQTFIPWFKVVYKTKKGKVSQATLYDVDADVNGVVTKQTPLTMYKFKYNKTKIGKVRYLSMINAEVGAGTAFFSWY